MAEASAKFPAVQGGGSLIIAWQIKGKTVLVVGGGEVCVSRFLSLFPSGFFLFATFCF